MTKKNEPRKRPRTYDEMWADRQAAWNALTPAEQTKQLLANKAVHDAAHAERAERDAGLHEHVLRLNAAINELRALVDAEEAEAKAEVEAKIAEEQAQLATKQ